MSLDRRPLDGSDGEEEEEELMFAFEEHDASVSPRGFYSIDGVAFARPAHPMAAILTRLDAKKRSRQDDDVEEPEALDAADLKEEKPVTVSRKRKTFDLPNVPVRVVRPVAKRLKSDTHERCITAPACLMGRLSLHRMKDPLEDTPERENEADKDPFRSASIDIPERFYPIPCPGDAPVGRDRSQSFSSSSSSKSGLFCRRSLDVASPLRVRLNDLELHSSTGSYTGS